GKSGASQQIKCRADGKDRPRQCDDAGFRIWKYMQDVKVAAPNAKDCSTGGDPSVEVPAARENVGNSILTGSFVDLAVASSEGDLTTQGGADPQIEERYVCSDGKKQNPHSCQLFRQETHDVMQLDHRSHDRRSDKNQARSRSGNDFPSHRFPSFA